MRAAAAVAAVGARRRRSRRRAAGAATAAAAAVGPAAACAQQLSRLNLKTKCRVNCLRLPYCPPDAFLHCKSLLSRRSPLHELVFQQNGLKLYCCSSKLPPLGDEGCDRLM
jgi:hypothetical protein